MTNDTPDERRDQVSRLLGFLRGLVRSRSVSVTDVDAHPAVLWVGKSTPVSVRAGATPGRAVVALSPDDDQYEQLSAMVDDLIAEPEALELVLASALVTVVDRENDAEPVVREHLLTQDVVAERDPESGAITVSLGSGAVPMMHDTHLLASIDGIGLSDSITPRGLSLIHI